MSINLARNIVFEIDYFYEDPGVLVAGTLNIGQEIVVPRAGLANITATWMIPNKHYLLSNVEILSESPIFTNLMERKMNFIHLFKTLPSNDTKVSLENFMNSVITSMLEALKTADSLYWLDRNAKIRSQYTLEYCLTKGCELAAEKLKLQNTINDIQLPDKIIKEHVEEDFEADIRSRKKNLDIAKAAKAEKKSNKKSKK